MTKERNIRRTVLPSGLIVLTERMEHVRSVAMGVWMRAGSRHEVPELNGISHFVEHMVFKGTKSRSAQRIAREVDAIGGNLDAFTGKETVCFNIKVLDEHVPTALDVLSDLCLNPVFASEEIARERGVILEEIKMDEDSPDTLVHEIFTQNFWKGHPLGKPILGTRETVRSFEQNTLVRFFEQRFQSGNMVFSAAASLAQQEIPRAGPALSRRSRSAHRRRVPLHNPPAQHHPRRRHELAPLPDRPRRARPRLRHLLRPRPLSRHRLPLRLRRNLLRPRPPGHRPHYGRVPPPQSRAPPPRRAPPRSGPAQRQSPPLA